MHDLLLMKIKALYDVENIAAKTLPLMARKASHQELKKAFRDHIDETRAQIARLEQVFAYFGQTPERIKVAAIRGLADDAKWVIRKISDTSARDVALIGAAEYIEQYEMTGYEVATAWAQELGYAEMAELLAETMREEIAASEKLRELGLLRIDRTVLSRDERSHAARTYFGLLSA